MASLVNGIKRSNFLANKNTIEVVYKCGDAELHGCTYTGKMMNGKPHGTGKMSFNFGSSYQVSYEGMFENGVVDGE